MCEDEANNRSKNSYDKRYTKARFPTSKSVADFDFNFQPSIDKRTINDALTCHYIENNQNIVFMGNPGTGKSHLSIALGIQALARNHKVLFTSVSEMLQQLHIAKADNTYHRKLNEYLEPNLLIMDELGFRRLPDYAASDLFEVISKRYEHGSCIITTNKPFESWGDILGNNVLTSAMLDRIVHHSIIIKINGPSYRTKNVKLED